MVQRLEWIMGAGYTQSGKPQHNAFVPAEDSLAQSEAEWLLGAQECLGCAR